MQSNALTTCLLFSMLLWPCAAQADVVELASGAKLAGRASSEQSRTTLTIEFESGGRLTLPRSEISALLPENAAEIEYRKRAPTVPDTVASHWALAAWCQKNKLRDAYRHHLQRIIELEPDHAEARVRLGHQQVNGQWLDREQLMLARGMIRYEGQFRTRQEVAILLQAKQGKKQTADWKNLLKRWRNELDSRDRTKSEAAIGKFRQLKDPAAAAALANLLLAEEQRSVKILLLDVAGSIRHFNTIDALARVALQDADEELRYSALEQIQRARVPGANEPFVRALKSSRNEVVNRAALALQELEAQEAVAPLINALVTEHRFKVGESSGGGQRFDISGGGGGFNFGGGGPKIVKQTLQNAGVLSALVGMTGVNFGYDQPAWRDWLASQAQESALDLRRDG